MNGPEDQNLDFMDQLEAATRARSSFVSNAFLFAIAALVAIFIVWASLASVEEIARGSGQVMPTREIHIVQSLEGGLLQELLVKQGERVKKDQVLMRLSDVAFASEQGGAEAKFASLNIRQQRLEAEANGKAFTPDPALKAQAPDIVANEEKLYASRQQELKNALSILDDKISKAQAETEETKAQITRLSGSRGLLQQEVGITRDMVAQKAVSKLELIRLERELTDISGQLAASTERLEGLNAELSAAEKQKSDQHDRFRSQALNELSEVKTQIAQLQEGLKSIGDRVSRAELRAPVDGIVNNIAVRTVGGVIEPAQKVMDIVPVDDELKIVARVMPNDIAFLKEGQEAKVKLSTYDPQKYGALDGRLARIGASSITDDKGNIFFEIEVHTDKNYLGTAEHPLPIGPGMVADVEVITGRRTIMEYLLRPVLRARDRALRER